MQRYSLIRTGIARAVHLLIILSMAVPTLRGNPLQTGEELTFNLSYGIVKAGVSKMFISGVEDVHGHTTYALKSRTRTSNFFDPFYTVRDTINSWIDTTSLATIRFTKSLNEGSYHKDYAVWFDYDKMQAYSNEDTFSIETKMQDVLSQFYYIRSLDLQVGDTLRMSSFDNDKVSPFLLRVKRTETISVPAGKFDCFVVQPFTESDFLFKYQGRLQIWISRDQRRIPVKMKSQATFGALKLILREYRLSGNH